MSIFSRKVTIIIPVYNGYEAFKYLIESLAYTYSKKVSELNFVVIDDASTDCRIKEFLQIQDFFNRSDVAVYHNHSNIGFAGTINRGLHLSDTGSDIVLLNSDTLVFGKPFQILQKVAYEFPNIASVTPLTNNCTIASLLNWPIGTGTVFNLSPKEIVEIVENLKIPTPIIEAPTGIGFCMYLTREALSDVGEFDEQTFGRGYGEENDWSQRAIKKGYLHVICTETFVYHKGEQSYEIDLKKLLVSQNSENLRKKHPRYFDSVEQYIFLNPLEKIRAKIIWCLLIRKLQKEKCSVVTFFLHEDPLNHEGGTGWHVRSLTNYVLDNEKLIVIQIFSIENNLWKIRVISKGQSDHDFELICSQEQLIGTLSFILQLTNVLHVHHLSESSPQIRKILRQPIEGIKIFTAHDFWALCPSIKLISRNLDYCGLPEDTSFCNNCLKSFHKIDGVDIYDHRREMVNVLNSFDMVFVPSNSAKKIFIEAFQASNAWYSGRANWEGVDLADKLEVQPNALFFKKNIERKKEQSREKRLIVFLGVLCPAKGSEILKFSLKKLKKKGFSMEIWGCCSDNSLCKEVIVREYKTMEQLQELAKKHLPYATCLPSTCPESFSYTFYEAMGILQAPIIVGPYGNPAEVVEKYRIGVVMKNTNWQSLIKAVDDLKQHYLQYLDRMNKYSTEILEPLNPEVCYAKILGVYKSHANILNNSKILENNIDNLVHVFPSAGINSKGIASHSEFGNIELSIFRGLVSFFDRHFRFKKIIRHFILLTGHFFIKIKLAMKNISK